MNLLGVNKYAKEKSPNCKENRCISPLKIESQIFSFNVKYFPCNQSQIEWHHSSGSASGRLPPSNPPWKACCWEGGQTSGPEATREGTTKCSLLHTWPKRGASTREWWSKCFKNTYSTYTLHRNTRKRHSACPAKGCVLHNTQQLSSGWQRRYFFRNPFPVSGVTHNDARALYPLFKNFKQWYRSGLIHPFAFR